MEIPPNSDNQASLLHALGVRHIDARVDSGSAVAWEELLSRLTTLDPLASAGLKHGITQVLLRAVETALLGATPMIRVAEFWDSLRGQVDEQISQRVENLIGDTPGAPLIAFLRACLHANVLHTGRKAVFDRPTVLRVFEMHRRGSPTGHALRCSICGYHFRKPDLSPSRRKCAKTHGFVFARDLKVSRVADRLKPSSPKDTVLHLDHIIPEASHGGSDPDNLQVTCAYCNRGRKYYWRSLEGLSMFVAGALSWMPSVDEESRGKGLRHAACVAAYEWNNYSCSRCGKSARDAELAVSRPDASDKLRFWGVPWKLIVQCYRCRAHSRASRGNS